MATFSVLGVDGKPYRIKAPEGYTQEQAYAAARANNPGLFPERQPDPNAEMRALQQELDSLTRPITPHRRAGAPPQATGAAQQLAPPPSTGAAQAGEQSALRQVADIPLNLAQGAVTGVRMVADAFGANNAISQALRTSEEYLGALMSAQAKNDQQEIARIMAEAEGKGVGTEVKAALKALSIAPADLVSNALGTMAPMILAALGGKVLGAGALGMRVISGVTAGVQGAGIGKDALYQTTYDVLTEHGVPEEEARRRAELAQSYSGENLDLIAMNVAAGALSGAVGAERSLANALAGRLGAKTLAKDALVEGIEIAGKTAARGGISTLARGAALEAIPEGIQGGLEQITSNVGSTREGFERPTFAGAAGGATLEAGVSAPIGGFSGVRDRIAARKQLAELENLKAAQDAVAATIAGGVSDLGSVLPADTIPPDPTVRGRDTDTTTNTGTTTGPRVRGREYDLFGEVPKAPDMVGPPAPTPAPDTAERVAELHRRIQAADPTKPAGARRIAQARAELDSLRRYEAEQAGQMHLFDDNAAFQVSQQGLAERFGAVVSALPGHLQPRARQRAEGMAERLAPILQSGDANAITEALEAEMEAVGTAGNAYRGAVEAMVESALEAAAVYEPIAQAHRREALRAMVNEAQGRAKPGVRVGQAEPTETSAQLMREAEQNRQQAEQFEARLADVDTRVQASREQALLERRERILRDVIADESIVNPLDAATARLAKAGIPDANLTADELMRLERARVARQGFAQSDTLPASPNELDAEAIGIPEKAAPAPTPAAPEATPAARRNENRSFRLQPPPSTQADLDALQRAAEKRARKAGTPEVDVAPEVDVEPDTGAAPQQGRLPLEGPRPFTAEDIRALGVGPTNKSLRPLVGKDLNDPGQAMEVAQALRDYANQRGRSAALRDRILTAIQTGEFGGRETGDQRSGTGVPVSGGGAESAAGPGAPDPTGDSSAGGAVRPAEDGAPAGDGALNDVARADAVAIQAAADNAVEATAQEIGAEDSTVEAIVTKAKRARRKPKTLQPATAEEVIVDAATIEDDIQAVVAEAETPAGWAQTANAMRAGIEQATTADQLIEVALKAGNHRLAVVLNRLKQLTGLSAVGVRIEQGGDFVAQFRGKYGADPAQNTEAIVVNARALQSTADPQASAQLLAVIITHELVHAATAKAMDPTLAYAMGLPLQTIQRLQTDIQQLVSDLQAAMDAGKFAGVSPDVRDALQRMIDTPQEIPTYGLTDRGVQDALRGVATGKNRTLWSKFVSAVRNLLGMDDGRQTLLEDVLVLSDSLMAAQSAWAARGAEMAPVYDPQTTTLDIAPGPIADAEQARVLNEKAGNLRGIRPVPDTTFVQRLMEKVAKWNFRANAIDSASAVSTALETYMREQTGQTDIWDLATGQIRPDALMRQADQSDGTAMAVMQDGGFMYNSELQAFTSYRPQVRIEQRPDGLYRLYDVLPDWTDASKTSERLVFDGLTEANAKFMQAHPASLTNMMFVLDQLATRLGDADLAREMANKALYAARFAELRTEFNRLVEAADNLEAQGKVKQAQQARAAIRPLPKTVFMDDGSTISLDEAIAAGQEILAATPELRLIQQMNRMLNLRMVDAMERSGRIPKETAEVWRQHPSYVPFMRDQDYFQTDGKTVEELFQANIDMRKIPELQGGDAPLRDVFQNIMEEVFWMTSATMRTQANRGMLDALKQVYGDNLKPITKDTRPGSYDRNKTVTIFRDGQPEQYVLPAEDLVWGFEGTPLLVAEAPVRIMAAWSNLLRKLVTANPEFAISQSFQDAWRAMIASQTKSPFKLAGSVLARFATELAGGDATTDILSRMGIGGKIDSIPGHARDQVMQRMHMKANKNVVDVANAVQNFMGSPAISQDMGLRTATYLQAIKEGHSPAVAAMKAREIINFNRIGRSKFIRTMRMYVPFFNAWIQGLDVMYRAATVPGLNARQRSMLLGPVVFTAMKVMTLSTLYSMMLAGNDEWESMDDQQRDRMLFIPSDWAGTEQPLKIPVAPEVGFLLKGLSDRIYRQIISQNTENPRDAQKLMQSIAAGALDVFTGPNITPQIFKPILEVTTNYDFRTGNPVVGRAFEGLNPQDQYDAYTSQLAIAIARGAEKAGFALSPMNVDHVLRGHFGITGGMVLDITTALFGTGADLPIHRKPIAKLFTTAPQGREVKANYYEYSENVLRTTNSLNHMIRNGMLAEWAERVEDPKVLERWARQADIKYGQELTAYYRQQRNVVQNLPLNIMSRAEKERELARIDREEHETMRAYMKGKVVIR